MANRWISLVLIVLTSMSGAIRFDELLAKSKGEEPIFKSAADCPLHRCNVKWDRGTDLCRAALGRHGLLFAFESESEPEHSFSVRSLFAQHRASTGLPSLHSLHVKLQV
jgi:hypothetical protein